MIDPFSAIALGSTVLGGIMGAFGEKSKGEAEARALRLQGQAKGEQYEAEGKAYAYKAGIAEMNRRLKLQDADYARWAGDYEAETAGMRTGQAVGLAKAKQAGSGLEVDFGSPSTVRDSILEIGQFDQSMIRHNAARRAYGFEIEAANAEAEREINKMSSASSRRAAMFARQGASEAAESAEAAGNLGMMKSLIGTAGSVAGKWSQGNTLGMSTQIPSAAFMNNEWGW